jgi:hypothetical protein
VFRWPYPIDSAELGRAIQGLDQVFVGRVQHRLFRIRRIPVESNETRPQARIRQAVEDDVRLLRESEPRAGRIHFPYEEAGVLKRSSHLPPFNT